MTLRSSTENSDSDHTGSRRWYGIHQKQSLRLNGSLPQNNLVKQKFEAVLFALSHRSEYKIDEVVDLLVAAAAESGYLNCMGDEYLHFNLGSNCRRNLKFGDCLGVLRSILARLYTRCESAYPYRLDGGPYGFRAHVKFPFLDGQVAELNIHTRNTREFPELTIESIAC